VELAAELATAAELCADADGDAGAVDAGGMDVVGTGAELVDELADGVAVGDGMADALADRIGCGVGEAIAPDGAKVGWPVGSAAVRPRVAAAPPPELPRVVVGPRSTGTEDDVRPAEGLMAVAVGEPAGSTAELGVGPAVADPPPASRTPVCDMAADADG
jgi:hypothetical protein